MKLLMTHLVEADELDVHELLKMNGKSKFTKFFYFIFPYNRLTIIFSLFSVFVLLDKMKYLQHFVPTKRTPPYAALKKSFYSSYQNRFASLRDSTFRNVFHGLS